MSLELAEKVKGVRQSLDLSQREFANLLSINHSQIAEWEVGSEEPTICWQRIIQFLEDCTSSAMNFLQGRPWLEDHRTWGDQITEVLQSLDWTQEELATFLGIYSRTIRSWTKSLDLPDHCYQIMISLLSIYSDVDRKDWPSGLYVEPVDVVTSERIKLLRLSLSMTQLQFANVLHTQRRTVGKWEDRSRTPEWGSNLLLRVIETYPRSLDILEQIPWGDEQVSADRAVEIRNSLGMTQLELAHFLGTTQKTIGLYEREGIGGDSQTLVYLLLENYPEEFFPLVENLPNPSGQACPIW